MPYAVWLAVAWLALSGCGHHRCRGLPDAVAHDGPSEVRADFRNFYGRRNLAWAAGGFGVAAVLANTAADENLSAWYQENVRDRPIDKFADVVKGPGYGEFILPTLGVLLLVTEHMPDEACHSTVGEWCDRSMRAMLVGAPLVVAGQYAIGSSRPGESDHGSDWMPFHDSNGISGHAFLGAVPLVTMAQMTEDPYVKSVLYFASTLCAWSRVNDDAHYTSQSLAGWWVAYLACSAVNETEMQGENWSIGPLLVEDGVGVGFELRH